jgi:environmental stress-induced protein Ves
MPWKNGGGSTTEIAIGTVGASLDAFDWRISIAQVAGDGPFSLFDGIDRTLAVIAGGAMELTINDQVPLVLDRGSDPLCFPGDVATTARLLAGEIIDLNVMTRRSRFTHRVVRVAQPTECAFDSDDIAIVLSIDGTTDVSVRTQHARLEHADAVLIESGETTTFQINPAELCYLIRLRAAG